MKPEILTPLLGILLGWILSELTGAFRIMREERQCLKAALAPMLRLYFEQFRINEILTFFNNKMGNDFEKLFSEIKADKVEKEVIGTLIDQYITQFEEIRKQNILIPEKNSEAIASNMAKAIEGLSKVDPSSAYKIGKLLAEFTLFQAIEMPPSKEDPNIYLNLLATVLSIYRDDMKTLRSLILRVSFKAGLLEWVRFYFLLRREESELIGGTQKAHEQILKSA